MIELLSNELAFSFPEVHPEARLTITFQRTLRIPDDGNTYPLPPGIGKFPLRHVDDFSSTVPESWVTRGGILLPMYQSEALWINFRSAYIPRRAAYPFAIKIAAGKINAVNGKPWENELRADPQSYVVVPGQPWIDGFCVGTGVIRQFVAMPLGSGYTVEEQVTHKAEHGGLQIAVYPMLRSRFDKLFPEVPEPERDQFEGICCCSRPSQSKEMGLAPGGRMRQQVYRDEFGIDCWDLTHTSRSFVHIANSLVWRSITGINPPTVPFTAKEYTTAGLPWFDYYADGATALNGATSLAEMKSVEQLGKIKGDTPLPENDSVNPNKVVKIIGKLLGNPKDKVREGKF